MTFIKSHKILCFAETKLDSHDIISVDGYTYFNQPRRQSYIRKSGGLGFLVHDSIAKYAKRITEPPFLDLHLSVANGFVSLKIHDKRDDFDFDII